MIQERVRLGQTLTLPRRWQEVLRAADGDEVTVLYHENGILIVKDLDHLVESLHAFSEVHPSAQEDYMVRVAELAAEYETSPLVQWAAEYDEPVEPMSPELEALYLEAEQEQLEAHLPPLRTGTSVELPPEFKEHFKPM